MVHFKRDGFTVSQLREALENGEYAWPGCYPCYFIVDDGKALSFDAVKKELRQVVSAIHDGRSDGWRVVAVDVNWEDSSLYCAHTGKRIASAYEI